MKQITMKELKNKITDKLDENLECEYFFITINGVTINFSSYEIINLENDYFTIDFYYKGILSGSYRCWQTPIIYFNYEVYEIV